MGNCNEESCPINACGKELRISVPESFHNEDFFVFEGLYHRTEENPTSQDSFCQLTHAKYNQYANITNLFGGVGSNPTSVNLFYLLEIDQTIKSDLVIENSIVILNLFMRLTVGLSVTINWEILFWSLSQMLSVLNTFQIPTGSTKILKTLFTIMIRQRLRMIIMTTDYKSMILNY